MIDPEFSKNVLPLLIVAGIAVAAAYWVTSGLDDNNPAYSTLNPTSQVVASPQGALAPADAASHPAAPREAADNPPSVASPAPTSATTASPTPAPTAAKSQATPPPETIQRLHSGWSRTAQFLEQQDKNPLIAAHLKELDRLVLDLEAAQSSVSPQAWQDLYARQRVMTGLLRQVDPSDPVLGKSIHFIERQLDFATPPPTP